MGTVDDALADLAEPAGVACSTSSALPAPLSRRTEGMSYGMPALKLDDKPLVGVVAATKHLSLFPFSPAVVQAVAGRLNGFSLSKGTIRFTAEHPLPDDVVEDIVRLRQTEIRK
ncbi:DUF1801 domain-containing protein [Pseudarthrobacter sp. NamE2]|nr:DUF1801 domain-containing protein [Pseudarthrobacter sp. NamE2]TLM80733.1 DUF1801 domain-containing protein [Pseudarthrobacter sp. NamE2]